MYEDARLEMSHGSQHCLQKAEGQSFGTTSVQEYSAHDQCAQVSDGAEGAQALDGAEGARVSDDAEDVERVRLLVIQLSTK